MYTCLASDFEKLEKRIASTKRLINGYGFDCKFEVIKKYEKQVPAYRIDEATRTEINVGTVIVECVDFEFEMEDFKVGDYIPVALIEHSVVNDPNHPEITNVITLLSDKCGIQDSWYSIGGHCDDCNDKYLRQKTVMLMNNEDGSYRQIGMSCLKKYLGISCFNVIKNFRSVEEVIEEANNRMFVSFDGVDSPNYYETERYLGCVYDVIKQFGRIKYKTVEEAKKLYNSAYEPSNEAKEMIANIKNCFASDMFKEYANNSMNNFTSNVASNVFASYTRRFELLTYTFDVYKKYIAWLEKKDRESHSEFVGEVGQKITVEVETSEGYNVETKFGYATINKFTDADGNIYTWFTSTKFYSAGIKLKITGTIKAHNEYNGVKQTVLTRVKEV